MNILKTTKYAKIFQMEKIPWNVFEKISWVLEQFFKIRKSGNLKKKKFRPVNNSKFKKLKNDNSHSISQMKQILSKKKNKPMARQSLREVSQFVD
jgi:hypothetical protein